MKHWPTIRANAFVRYGSPSLPASKQNEMCSSYKNVEIDKSENAVLKKLWIQLRGRGRAHSSPEVLQSYCSGVTMRKVRVWVIHKPLPLSFTPLPAHPTPTPAHVAGLRRSWLIHSQPSLKPAFVIQMKLCYLRDHPSSHYSAVTYFIALAAGAPFIKMLQSLSMCRGRLMHTHTRARPCTHLQSHIWMPCTSEWVENDC